MVTIGFLLSALDIAVVVVLALAAVLLVVAAGMKVLEGAAAIAAWLRRGVL